MKSLLKQISEKICELEEKNIFPTRIICSNDCYNKLKKYPTFFQFGEIGRIYGLNIVINNKVKGFKVK